ncbi:MAG: GGDEF domain-containing protein [Candidatus Omnitrophica bacterium]|nr:GGDEF domain-containing protein [Candidatus Omnitrophota bacterium]
MLKEETNLLDLDRIQRELTAKLDKMNKDIEILKYDLNSHIQLYEVTKDISKYLNEEDIFNIFKDKLNKFIVYRECLFIKKQTLDLEISEDDFIFKLNINDKILGYLVLKGCKSSIDKEKFSILAEQFLLTLKRAKLYQQVQELSIIDSLTGLFNRRYFLERLEEEIERTKKFSLYLSFLMLDIDNFKYYNDNFGHLVGDAILKNTSSVIKENTRHIDLVARYGGEEFAILLPETTKTGAYFAAERIRKNLEKQTIRAYDEELNITVSIGVASLPEDATTSLELIERSDKALYKAKRFGKNRVCIYKA